MVSVENLSAIDVWTLAFFGFQIYFDFSAYSHSNWECQNNGHIFPRKFQFPYVATLRILKRWHISLSSWIRDYLYLPLSKQKVLDRLQGYLFQETKKLKKVVSLYL